jgi:hypothetical protein
MDIGLPTGSRQCVLLTWELFITFLYPLSTQELFVDFEYFVNNIQIQVINSLKTPFKYAWPFGIAGHWLDAMDAIT